VHFSLFKYTTLKVKDPTSKLPKCYYASSDLPNNSLTLLGTTQMTPNNLKSELHKSLVHINIGELSFAALLDLALHLFV
jgi:hypothetical protein